MISRQGYPVEVISSEGEFKPYIILPSDLTNFEYLDTASFCNLDSELKDVLVSYLFFIIYRYHPGTVKSRFKALLMMVKKHQSGMSVAEALLSSVSTAHVSLVPGCKEFAEYLILHEYDESSYSTLEEVARTVEYSGGINGYLHLFMLDEERGPFTKDEMLVLSAEVENLTHSLELRVLLDLCLTFGLRPIQIALLKIQDFVRDKAKGICYLRVPRVKNRQRDRRNQFSIRIVSEDTAVRIEELILEVEAIAKELSIECLDLPLFFSGKEMDRESYRRIDHLWVASERKSKDLYEEAGKVDYSYHRSAHYLRYIMAGAEEAFPLSPRTGRRFNLFPYRFRYTVGTQAVISGCSPEEVADLLDHTTVLSVKHYFRFTHEMWEILENASRSRPEHRHFSAAWLREDDVKDNVFTRQIFETKNFTAIGRCTIRGACFDEPAVACYSCKRFCPGKEVTAHQAALRVLLERRDESSKSVSSAMVASLDSAIAGCEAAVAYATGDEVILIHSGGADGQL